ncbi:MAG: hypothetical protein KAT07_06920 [Calditrichia bacterium]|nr:hypothetical protein [Calditrichia bacterium]
MNVLSYFHQEQAYTILETLVALTILFMTLIPFFMILNNMLMSQNNLKRTLAINLAERELEKCLITEDFTNSEIQHTVSGFNFLIRRNVKFQGKLVMIILEIRDKESEKSLIKLKTFRHYEQLSHSKQIFSKE